MQESRCNIVRKILHALTVASLAMENLIAFNSMDTQNIGVKEVETSVTEAEEGLDEEDVTVVVVELLVVEEAEDHMKRKHNASYPGCGNSCCSPGDKEGWRV